MESFIERSIDNRPRFAKRGIREEDATRLLVLSSTLALQARDEYWNEHGKDLSGQSKPLGALFHSIEVLIT